MTTQNAQALLSASPFQITIWQAGHSYAPGDVVQPTAGVNAGVSALTNGDFSSGSLSGWTSSGSWVYDGTFGYSSSSSAKLPASSGTATLTNNNQVAVTPGQVINVSSYYYSTDPAFGGNASIDIQFAWYDANSTLLSTYHNASAILGGFANSQWSPFPAQGVAPDGAAFLTLIVSATNNSSTSPLWMDQFYWDYIVPSKTPANFFTNITASVATSGPTEPDWTNAGTNTGNVVDGGITWARGQQSVILWKSYPLLLTGATEPTWPLVAGATVFDNNMTWKCITPQIQDSNCPQSKFVVLAGSKILAGDTDIVRFSATLNPLDWTSEADAGFLPYGQQTYGANPITAMSLYRSNLVVFNAQGLQIWQVDEDPANMSLITALPIGSIYHKALAPVNNDLFFLAAQGVRTMGITGGSGNAQAGDVGMPIDSLVQLGVAYCNANGKEPLATYVPGAGQYWLHFPGWQASGLFVNTPANTSNVFVYTMSRIGEVGAWSRYNFPFPSIDAFCQLNDDLYIRSGDDVLKLDAIALYDYAGDTYNSTSRQVTFTSIVQWPWLDFGQSGITKQLIGVDVVGRQSGNVTVSIGYDESNAASFTTPFAMPADSVPGNPAPIPVVAPSLAVRLSMTSTDQWQIHAVNVYLRDEKSTS